MIRNKSRITCRQNELHDIAEESTNGVFASTPDETKEESKKNHSLVDNFIKKRKEDNN